MRHSLRGVDDDIGPFVQAVPLFDCHANLLLFFLRRGGRRANVFRPNPSTHGYSSGSISSSSPLSGCLASFAPMTS
jgi:hypothetical protein